MICSFGLSRGAKKLHESISARYFRAGCACVSVFRYTYTPFEPAVKIFNKRLLSSNSSGHNSTTTLVDAKETQGQRRKSSRLPAKTSLRRVAVEAQRSKDGTLTKGAPEKGTGFQGKTVVAYCAAEQFDLNRVVNILRGKGYEIDPYRTGLYPQVVHIRLPVTNSPCQKGDFSALTGDVFIFPSGTLVAWGVPDGLISMLASSTLLPAAINPHVEQIETEDLDYVEDPTREGSSIKGDIIHLGTKAPGLELKDDVSRMQKSSVEDNGLLERDRHVDTVLAKIAFSSGLARSTKLAVLESLLNDYFESTRSIPTMLSRGSGSRLPFTRSFVLQKTGQLLSVRAQLNLYSELTDSLPDLFWDSRHDLGLEGYYDQVGRALDIGIRIKTLNEKMDYSQEIASVLREQLSEQHSLRLEWIIIALIAVEVCFEIRREWKEHAGIMDERTRKLISR